MATERTIPPIDDDVELTSTPSRADIMARVLRWFNAAQSLDVPEPASVVISSVDADGFPNARVVLCRGIAEEGITFFTNFNSAKGRELLANPKAAATFHWMPLRRQLRLQGRVRRVEDKAADAYWQNRSRESQLYSAVSNQSGPLQSREAFERAVEAYRKELDGAPVPRPPHWSGFLLTPHAVEFWTEGAARNHTRERFFLQSGGWVRELLSP